MKIFVNFGLNENFCGFTFSPLRKAIGKSEISPMKEQIRNEYPNPNESTNTPAKNTPAEPPMVMDAPKNP
ncbi:hypothetical protein ES703_35497 [subsurface metagenome]